MAAVPSADLGRVGGQDSLVVLSACEGISKVAGGAATIDLSGVMNGGKESACSFPNIFKSMNILPKRS